MNEKALGYVIIFAGFIILSIFSCRWILHAAYKSAGKNLTDIMEYRKVLRKSDNTPKRLSKWLMEVSEEPTKTHKLLTIYQLCKLPSVICMIIAIIGLFTHATDRFLDIAAFAIIGFNIIMAFVGAFQKTNRT